MTFAGPRRVAIVGARPSGFYATDLLFRDSTDRGPRLLQRRPQPPLGRRLTARVALLRKLADVVAVRRDLALKPRGPCSTVAPSDSSTGPLAPSLTAASRLPGCT